MNYQQQRAAAFRGVLERLAREAQVPTLTADALAAQIDAAPLLAVLFTGDPTVSPESWDGAVVLPELVASCPGLRACVLDPAQSALAAGRFGVGKLPALVVLRDGAYLGAIEGMRDWQPFAEDLQALVAASAQPVPVAGVYPAADRNTRPA